MCHVAHLSFQYSALTENPCTRLGESRDPVETLKRLRTKGVSLLLQGRTLLSSAMSCALGSSLTFGVLFWKGQLGVFLSLFFPPPATFCYIFLFLVVFKLVEFSDSCMYVKIRKYIC